MNLPSRLSSKQLRAIRFFTERGFRPELSTYPDYRFTNKATGEVVVHSISTLVENYDHDRKEAAKERARLKRQEQSL